MNTAINRLAYACVGLCVLAVCWLLFALQPNCAQAASNVNATLKAGKTYSSYDVTGDGKADKLKITLAGKSVNYYKRAYVLVNGKRSYTLKPEYGMYYARGKIMRVEGGRVFLYLYAGEDNDDGPDYVLTWKSGKLVKVLDCDVTGEWMSPSWSHRYVDSIKASGNRIVVKHNMMTVWLGGIRYTYSYKYSGGKLVRTSTTSDNVKLWNTKVVTANKSLQLYKNAKCISKAGKLTKGTRATIEKIYLTKSCCSLKLKTSSGKSGWLKIKKTSSGNSWDNRPFEECTFAG